MPLFPLVQFDFPWALGPPEGRHALRAHRSDGAPTHVVVIATVGGVERRRLTGRRSRPTAPGEAAPGATVTTGRATVVDVTAETADEPAARSWMRQAGLEDAQAALQVLNRVLHAHRLATRDALVTPAALERALRVRFGFGTGDQAAEGRLAEGREIEPSALTPREGGRLLGRRVSALRPQEHMAAILAGRAPALVAEELALRARADLDAGRQREAALQLRAAYDAALAELPSDRLSADLSRRVAELGERRDAVVAAAERAAAGPLEGDEVSAVASALGRLEATLRARAVELG